MCVCVEFVAGGELFSRLQRNSCFSAPVALFYLAEIFCALSHIHSKGWVYRDLKVGCHGVSYSVP